MRVKIKLSNSWFWIIILLAGIIWGAGLSRVLAEDFLFPFFFRAAGTALCCVLGMLVSILVALLLRNKGLSYNKISLLFLPVFLPLLDILHPSSHLWRGQVLLLTSLFLFVLQMIEIGPFMGFGLAVIIPLLVYLPDISPYVGRADTFEFQVVAPQLGIAHPSGYPLYILIGKFFSLCPFGTTAWKVNLSSSVLASLSSGMMYLFVSALLPVVTADLKSETHRILSLLCALTMAFSPTLWSRAIEAEVYALNALMVTLILWFAYQWSADRMPGKVALPWLGLIAGLSLASHLTLGAVMSMVLMVMLHKREEIKLRSLILSFIAGIAGVSLYLFIPLRWPAVTSGQIMTFNQFARFVTNADSGGAFLPRAFLDDPARWSLVFRLLRQQIGLAGLVLAVVGLVVLIIQRWSIGLGSLLSFLTWLWFAVSFYVAEPDYSAFLIPAHIVAVVWLGTGAAAIIGWLKRANSSLAQLGYILLALLPASRLWITGPILDTKTLGLSDEQWGRYVLDLPLDEDGVILADSEKFPPLYYLQQDMHIREDLDIITLFNETQYREALDTNISQGRSVYIARYLPGLDAYGVSSMGPIIHVNPPISAEIPNDFDITFGDRISLRGFTLDTDLQGRPLHHLNLYWYSLSDNQLDVEVRLRLKSPLDSRIVWTSDPARPVGGYSSTETWKRGTFVQDYHALAWPEWLPEEHYILQMALYPRFGEDALLVKDSDDNWITLTTQNFGSQPDDYHQTIHSSQQQKILFGREIWLINADTPHQIMVKSTESTDFTFVCHNINVSQIAPVLIWAPLEASSNYLADFFEQSTGRKTLGNLLCNQQPEVRRMMVEAPAIPGIYRLLIGLVNENAQAYPAQCHWMSSQKDYCVIAQVEVTPEDMGLANYGGVFLLQDAALDVSNIPASGPLSVSLHWRSLRLAENDYTMFVQIIGPDGKIYGQVDSWPKYGGRPTSGWRVGEEIHDQYNLYLKTGAPSGKYEVILGWYLLADMHRIPVISSDGQIVNDFYTLGRFHLLPDGSIE